MFPEDRMMEVLIIGALALIVIGPKDLPIALRKLGQFVGKMRGMAAEFRASFDELARTSELDELRREVSALRSGHDDINSAVRAAATFDPVTHTPGDTALGPQMTALLPSAADPAPESLDGGLPIPASVPAPIPAPSALVIAEPQPAPTAAPEAEPAAASAPKAASKGVRPKAAAKTTKAAGQAS